MVFSRAFGAAAIAAAILLPQAGLHGAPAEAGKAGLRKPAQSSCDRAQFRVVVDVGHSAEVPGATSARGVPEYEFNLRLAQRIGRDLTAAGFRQAQVLITPGPARRGLFQRVARAASVSADLFISIHHDSVPERFLSVWEHEGKRLRYSDHFRGHSIFVSYDNPDPSASVQFARALGAELKKRGMQYTPHYAQAFMQERRRELLDQETGVYRFDQLIVLKDTRMPAVLFEAGSIINRDEEQLMTDPKHHARIGAAVTEAVDRYCAARAPQPPKPAPARLREAQGKKPALSPVTAAAVD